MQAYDHRHTDCFLLCLYFIVDPRSENYIIKIKLSLTLQISHHIITPGLNREAGGYHTIANFPEYPDKNPVLLYRFKLYFFIFILIRLIKKFCQIKSLHQFEFNTVIIGADFILFIPALNWSFQCKTCKGSPRLVFVGHFRTCVPFKG